MANLTTVQPVKQVGPRFNWARFFTYLVLIIGAIIAIIPFLATCIRID